MKMSLFAVAALFASSLVVACASSAPSENTPAGNAENTGEAQSRLEITETADARTITQYDAKNDVTARIVIDGETLTVTRDGDTAVTALADLVDAPAVEHADLHIQISAGECQGYLNNVRKYCRARYSIGACERASSIYLSFC